MKHARIAYIEIFLVQVRFLVYVGLRKILEIKTILT